MGKIDFGRRFYIVWKLFLFSVYGIIERLYVSRLINYARWNEPVVICNRGTERIKRKQC